MFEIRKTEPAMNASTQAVKGTRTTCDICGRFDTREIQGVNVCMDCCTEREWNDAAPVTPYAGVLMLEGAIEHVHAMPSDESLYVRFLALETLNAALSEAIVTNKL